MKTNSVEGEEDQGGSALPTFDIGKWEYEDIYFMNALNFEQARDSLDLIEQKLFRPYYLFIWQKKHWIWRNKKITKQNSSTKQSYCSYGRIPICPIYVYCVCEVFSILYAGSKLAELKQTRKLGTKITMKERDRLNSYIYRVSLVNFGNFWLLQTFYLKKTQFEFLNTKLYVLPL